MTWRKISSISTFALPLGPVLHRGGGVSADHFGRDAIRALMVTVPDMQAIASIPTRTGSRSEEHTSELPSHLNLVCRLLLEKKKNPLRVQRNPPLLYPSTHARAPPHLAP